MARKLCLQAWRHFRQRLLYATRPRSLRKKDSSSFLFFDILGILAPIHQKIRPVSRNSRSGRTADFCVVFRGDFQGKNSRKAALKSPAVVRIGQTMPYRIVVFQYQFGVPICRFSLMSLLPLALSAAFRSRWYARCGQGSSISSPQVAALHRRGAYPIQAGHSIGFDPSMNYPYHRTFLFPRPYVHKVGNRLQKRKIPRLRNGML